MLLLTYRAWLIGECLQTEPSKRITFNHIVRRLLPNMSPEFHSVSYYCMSQCRADEESEAQQSAGTANTCPSGQLNNSVTDDCVALVMPSQFQQSTESHLSSVSDDFSDICADVNEEKPQCTSVDISRQQQQRPLSFCAALDSRGITVNGGLAYHRLPAAC